MIQPDEWPGLAERMARRDPEALARVADACTEIIGALRPAQAGDRQAGDRLVDLHGPWIEAAATKRQWVCRETDLGWSNLVQKGKIGLREALRSFAPAWLEQEEGEPNPDAFGGYVAYFSRGIRCQVDIWCLERLGTSFERQITGSARRYARPNPGCSVDDLCQEGYFGLLEAFSRYDPARGAKFATYLGKWLQAVMGTAVRDGLGLSEQVRKSWRAVREAQTTLSMSGHEPTVEKMVALLRQEGHGDISSEVVEQVLERVHRVEVSLDAARENEDGDDAVPMAEQVPSPGPDPEVVAAAGDLFGQIALTHPRFAVLTVLRDYHELPWEEIIAVVRLPCHAKMRRQWPPTDTWLTGWQQHLPKEWPDVCALFATPPPTLTVGSLKTWYSRQRQVVREHFPEGRMP